MTAGRGIASDLEVLATLLRTLLPTPSTPRFAAAASAASAGTAKTNNKKISHKTAAADGKIKSPDSTDSVYLICLFFGSAPFESRTLCVRLIQLLSGIKKDCDKSENEVLTRFENIYLSILAVQKRTPSADRKCRPVRRVLCLAPFRKTKYRYPLTARSINQLLATTKLDAEKVVDAAKDHIDIGGENSGETRHEQIVVDEDETASQIEVWNHGGDDRIVSDVAAAEDLDGIHDNDEGHGDDADLYLRDLPDGGPRSEDPRSSSVEYGGIGAAAANHDDYDDGLTELLEGGEHERVAAALDQTIPSEHGDDYNNDFTIELGRGAPHRSTKLDLSNHLQQSPVHMRRPSRDDHEGDFSGLLSSPSPASFHSFSPSSSIRGHLKGKTPLNVSGGGPPSSLLPLLRETDIQTLESSGPKGWVNDEAINHLNALFAAHRRHWRAMPSHLTIADQPLADRYRWQYVSTWYSNSDRAANGDVASEQRLVTVLPLHLEKQEHWACAVLLDSKTVKWLVADSLRLMPEDLVTPTPPDSQQSPHTDLLRRVQYVFGLCSTTPTDTAFARCSQQDNTNDCGIFTLIHVLMHLIRGGGWPSEEDMPVVPLPHDIGLWRRLFGYVARLTSTTLDDHVVSDDATMVNKTNEDPNFVLEEDLSRLMPPVPPTSAAKPPPMDWEACVRFHLEEADETRRVVGQYLKTRRIRHDGITAQVSQAAGLFAALKELNTRQQREDLDALCRTIRDDVRNLTCAIDNVKSLHLPDEVKTQALEPLKRMLADVEPRLAFWRQRVAQLVAMATPLQNICQSLERTSKDLQVVEDWLQVEERKCGRWATCFESAGRISTE